MRAELLDYSNGGEFTQTLRARGEWRCSIKETNAAYRANQFQAGPGQFGSMSAQVDAAQSRPVRIANRSFV